jgi:hypothetical protein
MAITRNTAESRRGINYTFCILIFCLMILMLLEFDRTE